MKDFVIFIVLIIFGVFTQAKVTCPDIACMLGSGDGCINTAETDENGCTRCVCQPFPACPDLICPDIYCDYGKEVVDGCETCQCKLAPVTCPDIACMLGSGDGCINTAETDENGCTRCVCQPFPACPDLICPDIYCDYGKEVVDGCETCQCKLAPECLLLDCNTACLYGNVIDKTGCKTCECTNPCKDVLCLAPQVCVPDSNSPGKYRCVSQETQCCPKVHPPLHRSVQNVCQNCFLDCSTMKCAPGYSCCPDWNGCHSCVKSVPCF